MSAQAFAANWLRTRPSHALETIVACHASHRRNATWTSLPLAGVDRDIELRSG
ncbi:MAG: hypothetical protein O3C40_34930 [Planctomycetota bacterium]|nr:hypothetical protein [Planctomycetota bacterium]